MAEESIFVRKGRKPHSGRNVCGSLSMFAFCRFLFQFVEDIRLQIQVKLGEDLKGSIDQRVNKPL